MTGQTVNTPRGKHIRPGAEAALCCCDVEKERRRGGEEGRRGGEERRREGEEKERTEERERG